MRSRPHCAWLLAASLVAVAVASAAACGARTALDDGVSVSMGGAAPGPKPPDAGPEPRDAGVDVPAADDCADAGTVFVFALSQARHLFRFDPYWKQLTDLGAFDCVATPNSMAVDRKGTAYVGLLDGRLTTLAREGGTGGGLTISSIHCANTGFAIDQQGFDSFGMAFAADGDDPGETLYVAQGDHHHPSKGLARIDTQTFELQFIGPFSADLGDAVELTGTGDGRLFGFFLANPGPGAHIAEIDKTSGQILSDQMVPVGTSDSSFAFAFWGGVFYLFTQHGYGPTVVTRYDPATGISTMWTTLPDVVIVGAGVSTCAPL